MDSLKIKNVIYMYLNKEIVIIISNQPFVYDAITYNTHDLCQCHCFFFCSVLLLTYGSFTVIQKRKRFYKKPFEQIAVCI